MVTCEAMPKKRPSKMVHITIPGTGSSYSSTRTESISAKMKKILTSPKVMRGKVEEPPPFKTFGVLLDYLFERDNCEVPVIVTRLCEYLKKNGLRQEGLFRVNGNIKVVERLKTSFNKTGDAELEEIGDVPACASLLKMFLRELADPVIPDDLQPLFINVQHKYCQDRKNLVPRVKQLVKRMPKGHVALLKYLCEFMLYISNSSDGNKMTPLALAIVFGPNVFRCGEGLNGLRDQAYVNAVLLLMLQEYDEIFMVDEPAKIREPPERPLSYLEHIKKKNTEEQLPSSQLPQIQILQSSVAQRNVVTIESSSSVNDRPISQMKNGNNPIVSHSPTHSNTSPSSQMSKQLVESTINTAVKEILFGPGLVNSSCESERQDNKKQDESVEDIYLTVKDSVKNFSFEMTEETLNEGLVCQTRRTRSVHGKRGRAKRIAYEKCMSSPPQNKEDITDEDLDYIGGVSYKALERLTASRVPPPKHRRKPSQRRGAKEKKNEDTQSAAAGNESNIPLSINIVNNEFVNSQNGNADLVVKNIDSDPNRFLQTNENELNHASNDVQPTDNGVVSSEHKPILAEPSLLEQCTPVTLLIDLEEINQSMATVISPRRSSLDTGGEADKTAETSSHDRYQIAFHDVPFRSPHSSGPSSPSCNERRHEKWNKRRLDTHYCDMSPTALKKKIISLKKTISNLEETFEESHSNQQKTSEEAHIQKYIAELSSAKKQLRELLNDSKETTDSPSELPPVSVNTYVACASDAEVRNDSFSPKEETLFFLLKRLEDKRIDTERPQDILEMNADQLKDEKLAVQKALLLYENQHGRPICKEDKTLMRPLYDRYRKIKRLIATGKVESPSKQRYLDHASPIHIDNYQTQTLPVNHPAGGYAVEAARNERNNRVSHFTHHMHTNSDKREYESYTNDQSISNTRGDFDTMGETFSVTNHFYETLDSSALLPPCDSARSDDAILHEATINELIEQQRLTKRNKKRLGKLLKDFEDDFLKQYNRKVQKNDRMPKQAEYREYKLIKAKLRLVEALIEKKRGAFQCE